MGIGVTFTASRTITKQGREILLARCEAFRPRVESREISTFITGAAVGGDTVIALACLLLYPQCHHMICIPDYKHNEDLVALLRLWDTLPNSPSITIVDTGLDPLSRNNYMLAHGHECHGFPQNAREMMRGSGTWACYRSAVKRGMPTYMFPLNGDEPWTKNLA